MLPSFNAFLEFVGAKEKVKKCGFVMKVSIKFLYGSNKNGNNMS